MLHLVWVRNSRWLFLTAFFRLWSLDGHWVFPSPRIFDGWWTEYSCSDDSIKAQPQCMMYQPSVQRPEALFCGSGDLEGCHGPGLVWEAKRVLFHFLLGAGDHWWRRPRVEAPNISPGEALISSAHVFPRLRVWTGRLCRTGQLLVRESLQCSHLLPTLISGCIVSPLGDKTVLVTLQCWGPQLLP